MKGNGSSHRTGQNGKQQREAWFGSSLQALAMKLSGVAGEQRQSVAFPCEVGCGLAGGDWAAYRRMIECFARDNPAIDVAIVRFSGGGAPAKRPRHL